MTFTLTFGWWIVPFVVTIVALGFAAYCSRDMGNDRFGAGAVISGAMYLLAICASLIVWLIWALAV